MNPKSLLFGLAIGDALGVPVEFKPRSYLKEHPVTGMMDGGTHNQPAGTWSDDTSLTLCLADSLTEGLCLTDISNKIIKWRTAGLWTPHGNVFDVGCSTDEAINRLRRGVDPEKSGGTDEQSNGNGSLMRIAPLVFTLMDKSINERWEITKQVSSITHGHIRSVIGCFYYLEFMRKIIESKNKFQAYHELQLEMPEVLNKKVSLNEFYIFKELFRNKINDLKEQQIKSTGYLVHTLEASIWCLLTTHNYQDAVLKAVNLGYDTDTTGAVTGALAGVLYGYDSIPSEWINQLARKVDIAELADRMEESFNVKS